MLQDQARKECASHLQWLSRADHVPTLFHWFFFQEDDRVCKKNAKQSSEHITICTKNQSKSYQYRGYPTLFQLSIKIYAFCGKKITNFSIQEATLFVCIFPSNCIQIIAKYLSLTDYLRPIKPNQSRQKPICSQKNNISFALPFFAHRFHYIYLLYYDLQ